MLTTVPAVYVPLPLPLTTVSVYDACELKLAVTFVLAAGIVNVVLAAFAFATAAPVQFTKLCPAEGVLALIVTTVPAA
jgi:hypothetical protein